MTSTASRQLSEVKYVPASLRWVTTLEPGAEHFCHHMCLGARLRLGIWALRDFVVLGFLLPPARASPAARPARARMHTDQM